MPYAHLVDGSKKIQLSDFDPDERGGLTKEQGLERVGSLGTELGELEDLLFYAGQQGLLVVLQGIDCSGKDGAIRNILEYCNAQSCRVEPFKVPTEQELAHDFLWRIHARAPARGSMVVFNRSHYEDVVVVRVHELVPEKVWRRRYAHINHFEELLHDSNTILLKFYLHISKKEQEERLLDREKEREKAWKLSVNDWKERERWDDYIQAYEDAINECSTPHAPWHVVPADHKWFRNLAILEAIVQALQSRREAWMEALEETGKQRLEEIRAYREEVRETG
jgi:PPK2 family polyphosphate:nucleotide phosphotransferase